MALSRCFRRGTRRHLTDPFPAWINRAEPLPPGVIVLPRSISVSGAGAVSGGGSLGGKDPAGHFVPDLETETGHGAGSSMRRRAPSSASPTKAAPAGRRSDNPRSIDPRPPRAIRPTRATLRPLAQPNRLMKGRQKHPPNGRHSPFDRGIGRTYRSRGFGEAEPED